MAENESTPNENSDFEFELARKLPLWRSVLEEMIRDGVTYGQTIKTEWFEKRLRCKRDEMRFGLDISKIRRGLEEKGFYLSGRGQKGDRFTILAPELNADVMVNYAATALDALKRGVILGTNTRLDLLKAEDRRRHEAILERMSIKAVLMHRTKSIVRVVKKHDPKLLDKQYPAKSEPKESEGDEAT